MKRLTENYNDISCLIGDAICCDNGFIWISSMNYNGLYRYDIQKERVCFIATFPDVSVNESRIHAKAIKIDKKIYFFQTRAGCFHVYDVERGMIRKSAEDFDKGISRNGAFLYERNIYCISDAEDFTIYKIDTETDLVEKVLSVERKEPYKISKDIVQLGEKAYFACRNQDIILEFNCKKDNMECYSVSVEGKGFGTICHDGKNFWLSTVSRIVKWHMGDKLVKVYREFPKEYGMVIRPSLNSREVVFYSGFTQQFSKGELPFLFSVYIKGFILLFPYRVNMIVRINVKNGKMESYMLPSEEEDEASLNQIHRLRWTHEHYVGLCKTQNIWICSTKSRKIWRLTEDVQDAKAVTAMVENKEELLPYLTDDFQSIAVENSTWGTLSNLIKVLCNRG